MTSLMRVLAIALAVASPAAAFDPTANLGGPYELVDQHGDLRSEMDPDGRPQLVFFGYVNCPDICTAAMPLMADIADDLAALGIALTPIMVTVDPTVDTPETMVAPLADLHADFVGLTGAPDALQEVYEAFQIEITPLFTDPAGQTIYAHGSFLYLLDAQGKVLTLIPPILDVDQAVKIVRSYL